MAPRAYWKGYLRLSLVSCPIALYPAASSAERVSFNRINKKTGHRLKQLLVDSEAGEPGEKVGQEAFAGIRDVIRDKGMGALGRVVISRREHVIMLEAFDKGLLGTTLRYAYEVREAAGYFEEIPELKLPKEMKD